VALGSEKRTAKRLWPQRREDRDVFRRWVVHVGAVRAGVERVHGPGHAAMSRRGLLASGPVTDSFFKISKPAQTL
jgi:hypothetical protein